MDMGDIPPAPDDPDWDDWAEKQLEDVEFDTELGREMARDALRISGGDLSKAEFHERYGDVVEEEFGVDDRPTKAHAGSVEADTSVSDQSDESGQTRRRILQAMGGAAAVGAASLAGCVGGEDEPNPTGDHDPDTQLGMAIDTDRCIACLQCSEACKEENDTDVGVHWPYVFRYEDQHAGDTREGWLTRHCQHCSEPSCTYVCPTQARHRRTDDGVVLTDYDTCVGCKYCQVACPYGVNYLGKGNPNREVADGFDGERVDHNGRTVGGPPPKGVMGKCTFCVHRQDSDDPELEGTTACEQVCPVDAIHFGDMQNPDSDPRQHLREKEESNQYKLLDDIGNEPNIVFIGRKPTKDAEPIQGPQSYEAMGMRDGNYDYVVGAEDDHGGDQA